MHHSALHSSTRIPCSIAYRRERSHQHGSRHTVFYALAAIVLVFTALPSGARHNAFAEAFAETETLSAVVTPLERIEIYPPEIELRGPRGQMQLVVVGYDAAGLAIDLARQTQYFAGDENVVTFQRSTVRTAGNGQTLITARVGEFETSVPVRVVGFDQPNLVSFRQETIPALTSLGCNAGKCHGAPKGKSLFRLSLLASDVELDADTLTRETLGRRTNVMQPERSLILRKPTMEVPHGGGVRLRKSDPAYTVLKNWIAEGSRTEEPDAAECTHLEIYPPAGHILQVSHPDQQLLVVAHYADGSTRDVTQLSHFRSSDKKIADVRSFGLVTAKHRGVMAIVVRYGQQVSSRSMTVVDQVDGFEWSEPPVHNYIDELVYNKLKQLHYAPSDLCSDEEFVRRVSLDVTGRLLPVASVESFLADESPNKRAVLIDQLLDTSDYARFWVLKWGDLLSLKEDTLGGHGVHKYYEWLVRSWQENQPFDEFCRQLITAEGSTYETRRRITISLGKMRENGRRTRPRCFLGFASNVLAATTIHLKPGAKKTILASPHSLTGSGKNLDNAVANRWSGCDAKGK